MWRVWIEIMLCPLYAAYLPPSPSVWRVWIEITMWVIFTNNLKVTLRVEGVD